MVRFRRLATSPFLSLYIACDINNDGANERRYPKRVKLPGRRGEYAFAIATDINTHGSPVADDPSERPKLTPKSRKCSPGRGIRRQTVERTDIDVNDGPPNMSGSFQSKVNWSKSSSHKLGKNSISGKNQGVIVNQLTLPIRTINETKEAEDHDITVLVAPIPYSKSRAEDESKVTTLPLSRFGKASINCGTRCTMSRHTS